MRGREECRHKGSDSADMETEEFGFGIGFISVDDSLLSGYIFSSMNCRFRFSPHFVDLSSLFVKSSFGK